MNYTVVWRPQAEQELAQLWLAAPDRARVTAAVHRIEQLLGDDALHQGRWLYGTTRVLIDPPIAVAYEVIEDDKRANVLAVWHER